MLSDFKYKLCLCVYCVYMRITRKFQDTELNKQSHRILMHNYIIDFLDITLVPVNSIPNTALQA